MTKMMKISDLKPLAGYVLVEPAEAQKKTASGIYLPESSDEKPQYGKVLACGANTVDHGEKVTCPVKKNDQVLYKKWGGNEFKVANKEYQFLKFEDLIAVIG